MTIWELLLFFLAGVAGITAIFVIGVWAVLWVIGDAKHDK